MKPSSFASSREFKNFTHTLAAHSNGKVKAGQLQNCFAKAWQFDHPKALFTFLDHANNATARLHRNPMNDNIIVHLLNRDTSETHHTSYNVKTNPQAFYDAIKDNDSLASTQILKNLKPVIDYTLRHIDIRILKQTKNLKIIVDALYCFLSDLGDTTFDDPNYLDLLNHLIKLDGNKRKDSGLDVFYLTCLDSISINDNYDERTKQFMAYAIGFAILNTDDIRQEPLAEVLLKTLDEKGASFYQYLLNKDNAVKDVDDFKKQHLEIIFKEVSNIEDAMNLFLKEHPEIKLGEQDNRDKFKHAAMSYFKNKFHW